MKVAVVDIKGKNTSKKVELSDAIFGIEPNEHAIYLDVKQHLANKRQGTHKAKERADISGSTRKIKKQKGTGTARAGSIKSGVFRGGGRMFGPRPRNYSFKLNKNTKRLARKSALSLAATNNRIVVLESFDLEQPRTKDFKAILKSLDLDGKKATFVLNGQNKNVYLSARNLSRVNIVTNSSLNTYSVMNSDKIVFIESALEEFEANLIK
jgi:large subunit ribosomal protein L4